MRNESCGFCRARADDAEKELELSKGKLLTFYHMAESGVASRHRPEHEIEAYWNSIPLSMCADVLANDTKFAREALSKIESVAK